MKKSLLKNYVFAVLLIALSSSCFATGFVLDDGGSGNGDGDADTTPPYVAIRNPTGGILTKSQNAIVKVVASDLEGLDKVKIYVDNEYKKTYYSGSFDYSWDVSGYDSKSIHTVKAIAYDDAGNSRAVSKSYCIGYTEDIQHYKHQRANMIDGDNANLGVIAYSIIETDRFVIVLQVRANSILIPFTQTSKLCTLDVTTMYYCKDKYRLDYNLNPSERPITAPDGTLVELNFEMEETNTNLADQSYGRVMNEAADDRSFWPNFQTPDKVNATDMAISALSMAIGAVVGLLSLNAIAGFAVGKATDYFIGELRAGNVCPSETGYVGAVPVDINYRNQELGQNVKYPDDKYNYAYDAISRHCVLFRFNNDSSLIGQTLGLKFRYNAEYADDRTGIRDIIHSEWVKVEFKIAS